MTSSPSVLDEDRQHEDGSISFRICCKLSGQICGLITSQEVNIELGKHITKITGWKVDLTSPLLEVTVHMNDEVVVTGVPVISIPISKRSYILHHGLRSTVAWIMSHLADIQFNDVVVDPMCGKSTILIEAVKLQPGGVYIGCDKDKQQLRYSILNQQHAGVDINFLHTDTLHLPLIDESVDKIVCDAPFGQKHKTDEEIRTFYIKLLQQIYRVLKVGGKMVLLTSSRLRFHVLQKLKQPHKDIVPNIQPTITHCDNIQEDIPETFSKKGIQDLKQPRNEIISNIQQVATHNDKIQKDIPEIFSKNEIQSCVGNFLETKHHRPITESLPDDNSLKTSVEKSSIIPSENGSLVDNSEVPVIIPSKSESVYTSTSLAPDIQRREKHVSITSNVCDDNYSENESRNDSHCLATKIQHKEEHVAITSMCAIDEGFDKSKNESRNDSQCIDPKIEHMDKHVTSKCEIAESESRNDRQLLHYVEDHYIKLGETHAYINVAVKL
ncbi:uncharacterized protein LOC126822674 isoform X2 [Patella vulgata]|nr:uncharacterized protein LOC126822674 isoform X2 [Patella vulgata]